MRKPAREQGRNANVECIAHADALASATRAGSCKNMLDEYGFEIYEENEFPIAYLLTFRTFGTWLHGAMNAVLYNAIMIPE